MAVLQGGQRRFPSSLTTSFGAIWMSKILNHISDAELQPVFRNWIEFVEKVINAGGASLTE
jgi:hypothetical protein